MRVLIAVCVVSVLFALTRFVVACVRWRRRPRSMFFDGMIVVASSRTNQYEIFDPPPWRIHRWVWWWARRASGKGEVTMTFALESRPYRVIEIRK